MSEKFCIFCGNPPKDKNLEHVIPQWLIHLTGREKKDVFSLYPDSDKHLSFLQFKFPACTGCNTKYAKMEAMVKPVMEKVLAGQSISGAEASLLMDWFDKVRIGLWLTNIYYNPKLKKEIDPHFFIDSRVAKTDRMLSIQRVDFGKEDNQGIYFGGIYTEWFRYCPTAFTMVINDYYFFNAATNNLVGPRIGFPGMAGVKLQDPSKCLLLADVTKGTHKIVNPIIQTFIPHKESVTFYQPIYKDYKGNPLFDIDDYVLNHSYDATTGLGGVFVQHGNIGNTKYLSQEDRTGIKLKQNAVPDIIKDTLQFQIAINNKNIVNSPMSSLGDRINKMMLESIKRQK